MGFFYSVESTMIKIFPYRPKDVSGLWPLLACVMTFTAYGANQNPGCDMTKKNEVIQQIKHDFINHRMPRWNKTAKQLGTVRPNLIMSDNEFAIENGAYFLPFTAVGPKDNMVFFGIVDCRSGQEEYSVDNTHKHSRK